MYYCVEKDCKKRASYNTKGEKRGIFCKDHKEDGMIDVTHSKCVENGCNHRPNFNNKGEKKALYCKKHMKEGMIDISHKRCIEDGCDRQPSFNNEGKKKRLYCCEHKKEGMVSLVKKCLEDNCKASSPSYNYKGEIGGIYCGKHKKDGMINMFVKKCLECDTFPIYNKAGEKEGIYCKKHIKEGMVDVYNDFCIEKDCKTRAHYNFKNEKKVLYCGKHKKDGMINICRDVCKTPLCETEVSNKNYKGYCFRCFIYTFPEETVVRNYKNKELSVKEFVQSNFKEYKWIHDRLIKNSTYNRKPDLFLELEKQCIIVEIDENQHQDYDCSCENKRVMEISFNLNYKSVVFIRFNPDKYADINNKVHKSCWSYTPKTNLLKVSNKKEWKYRLSVLKETIDYWIKHNTDKTVETVHLFYNQN
jgi:hypothetical protein